MRARFRLLSISFLVCLTLVVSMFAFTGVAGAQSAHAYAKNKGNAPHLDCAPKRAYPDFTGEVEEGINGEHFTPYTTVDIYVQDYGYYTSEFTAENGSFSDTIFAYLNQGRSYRITAVDEQTGKSASCSFYFV
jgi:hypothetical protein